MEEINEQWIKDEANIWSLHENSGANMWREEGFIAGANSILPFYNELKAENERLRINILTAYENMILGSHELAVIVLRNALKVEGSVANPINSSTTPDKQSPQ
jgi:hypothetical protein